jgi:hypothetical protein
MGWGRDRGFTLFLEAGRRYVVLGVTVSLRDGLVWVQVSPDGANIVHVPISMFEVIDPEPSRHWEARLSDDDIRLWPHAFHEPDFHQRVFDSEDAALETLDTILGTLGAEANAPSNDQSELAP